jgi:hypothetical protein
MEENVYKRARLEAAKKHPEFRSVERAHRHVCMSREKLLMVEQTDPGKNKADPTPEDVMMMAQVYEAPQLRDYYCTHQCPLRKGEPPLAHESLGEISAGLMAALHFLDNASDRIHQILADSKISEDEQREFIQSLKILHNIAYSAESLELWAKKNGLGE